MCAESNNAQYYRTISSREQYRTISSFTCRRLGTAVTWWLGGDHFNMPMRCSLQQNTLHQNEMHYTGFDAVTCDTKCNTVGRRSDPVVIRWWPLVSGIFSHNGGDELMRRPLTNSIFQFKTQNAIAMQHNMLAAFVLLMPGLILITLSSTLLRNWSSATC